MNFKCIKKFKTQHFSGSDKPSMVFFLLIYVKIPTIVGILKGYCTVFQHALKLLEITGIVLS